MTKAKINPKRKRSTSAMPVKSRTKNKRKTRKNLFIGRLSRPVLFGGIFALVAGGALLWQLLAASTTVTYKATLTASQPSSSYQVTTGSGAFVASVNKYDPKLSLTIKNGNGEVVASGVQDGRRSTKASAVVNPDTYTVTVAYSGELRKSLNISVTLTYPIDEPSEPADTTPPTTVITSPTSGVVSGTINIAATASDDSGVSKVEFTTGGNVTVDTSSPYNTSWDTKTVSDGTYIVTAKAYDTAGNVGTASVTVTVVNGSTGGGTAYECTKSVSPGADLQAFVDSLTAGQTGCLYGGTFQLNTLSIRKGGTSDSARVIIASYPGERATINLVTEAAITDAADFVTLKRLDMTTSDNHVIRVFGDNVVIEDGTLTNNKNSAAGACIGVGGTGGDAYLAYNLKIQRNIFKFCGGTGSTLNHAIYAAHFRGLEIVDNLIYSSGAYSVQLYPDGANALVSHNVIDGGASSNETVRGGNVIDEVQSNHIFEYNIITNTKTAGLVVRDTSGHAARYNCFSSNSGGTIVVESGGITQVGNITASPGFVNQGSRDYRLQSNSGCLSVVQYDTYAKILANR